MKPLLAAFLVALASSSVSATAANDTAASPAPADARKQETLVTGYLRGFYAGLQQRNGTTTNSNASSDGHDLLDLLDSTPITSSGAGATVPGVHVGVVLGPGALATDAMTP